MKIKRILALLTASMLITSILLTGCSSEKKVIQSKVEQSITLNIGDEPALLDPQLVADVVPMRVINAIFEGLYRKDEKGVPKPAVAESCDISSDKLEYTFHLRDALWADGSAITSEDFKAAWLSALDPTPQNHEPAIMGSLLYCIKGADEFNAGKGKKEDVAIITKDSRTLVVTLVRPTPYFLDMICSSVYMPLNRDFYNKQPVENKVSKYGSEAINLLGNGPYKIKEWKHGETITLEKNDKYWNSKFIKLTKVTYKMIKDTSALLTAFKGNEIEMAEIVGESQKAEVEKLGNKVLNYETGQTFYIGVNVKDAFLNNVNIRKAMSYAFDRETHVKKVLRDDSSIALGFVNPVIVGGESSFRKLSGDLFKDNNISEAKELFSKGLKELNLTKAPIIKLLIDDKETAKRDAQSYQEMWRKNLGLEVEIDTVTYDAMFEKIIAFDYQLALLSWSPDFNDPTAFLDMFSSSSQYNVYQYENKAFEKLLEDSKVEVDAIKRMNLLVEAEKTVINDMVIIPVYFAKNSYSLNPKIKGLVRNNSAIQDIDLYWTEVEN